MDRSYRGIDADPGTGEQIVDMIKRVLGYVFRFIGDALDRVGEAGSLVEFAAATALFLLVLWLGWKVLRRVGLVKETTLGISQSESGKTDWRNAADAAQASGDLLQAIRYLYRQLVQNLAEKGWVADRPGVTSGECRRAVRSLPISGEVERATRSFEAVVYGKRAPRPEDVEALRSAEAAVSGVKLR